MKNKKNKPKYCPARILEEPVNPYTPCSILLENGVELTLEFPSDALRHHGLVQYDCFNWDITNRDKGRDGPTTHEYIIPTQRASDIIEELKNWDSSEMYRAIRE